MSTYAFITKKIPHWPLKPSFTKIESNLIFEKVNIYIK